MGEAMSKMPVSQTHAEMWVLSADRQTLRLNVPPVPSLCAPMYR